MIQNLLYREKGTLQVIESYLLVNLMIDRRIFYSLLTVGLLRQKSNLNLSFPCHSLPIASTVCQIDFPGRHIESTTSCDGGRKQQILLCEANAASIDLPGHFAKNKYKKASANIRPLAQGSERQT
jgi:hypothetical protein